MSVDMREIRAVFLKLMEAVRNDYLDLQWVLPLALRLFKSSVCLRMYGCICSAVCLCPFSVSSQVLIYVCIQDNNLMIVLMKPLFKTAF